VPVVLIIDDDPQIRELWRDVLQEEGLRVLDAPSGVDGVQVAKDHAVDLVVTDILMPDKDGIETLREIKAEQPALKVVVVSGGGVTMQPTFLNVAKKFGADATLQKPVDIGEFCSVVKQLLADS